MKKSLKRGAETRSPNSKNSKPSRFEKDFKGSFKGFLKGFLKDFSRFLGLEFWGGLKRGKNEGGRNGFGRYLLWWGLRSMPMANVNSGF